MSNENNISKEEYLNKAKDHKKTSNKDLIEAFYEFTEENSFLQVKIEDRTDAVVELLKMYEMSDVASVWLLDFVTDNSLTKESWSKVHKRIMQSLADKI